MENSQSACQGYAQLVLKFPFQACLIVKSVSDYSVWDFSPVDAVPIQK